ncbi:MAG: MlaD family protein [Planctomycetota bacterium]|nr:MlaD family protein [Planctomycetota bacterium]
MAHPSSGSFRNNVFVGLLTIITLAVLATLTGFLVEKKMPLMSRYQLSARFGNVAGLKVGDPVSLAGLNVGHVKRIRVSAPDERWPEPGYLVDFQIQDREDVSQWIREDSTFRISNENLFGNKRVEVTFGTTGAILVEGTQVDGEPTSGLGDIGEAMEDLHETLQNTAAITENLRSYLEGDEAADLKQTMIDLQESLANLRSITESTRATFTSWGRTVDKFKPWKWFGSDEEEDSEKEPDEEEEVDAEE